MDFDKGIILTIYYTRVTRFEWNIEKMYDFVPNLKKTKVARVVENWAVQTELKEAV
jgi:hypothetical protein